MYGYLFRRLLGTIPVMLVVAIFIFLMLRLTPSDPAAIIAGDNATTEQVAQIRSQLGLDRPLIEQFFIWSANVLTGDFGESFFFKKTVAALIGERIEPTLSLAFFTILIAVLVAVPLGVLAAHRHGSWIDRIVMGSHSHGPTFQMACGSVAEAVLGTAPCAVLAVKDTAVTTGAIDPPAALASSP